MSQENKIGTFSLDILMATVDPRIKFPGILEDPTTKMKN